MPKLLRLSSKAVTNVIATVGPRGNGGGNYDTVTADAAVVSAGEPATKGGPMIKSFSYSSSVRGDVAFECNLPDTSGQPVSYFLFVFLIAI